MSNKLVKTKKQPSAPAESEPTFNPNGASVVVATAIALFFLFLIFRRRSNRYINQWGYVALKKENELEHRYIAMQMLGRRLASNEVVHHINGKKTDNQIRNLCVMNREKHEQFHSWLRWKKEKSGRYPAFYDQNRILVNEYGGILLENVKPPLQTIEKKEVHNVETTPEEVELFIVRRNKVTNKMFVEFDEEVLISPDGKDVELDHERFDDPEEVPGSELTHKQITACQNKTRHRIAVHSENKKSSEQQKKLFEELRRERKRIADEKGIPVYIVFDNRTLTEIAEIMAVSESLMLKIDGVGPEKFRMYGAHFINVVKKFKNAG
jgi:superfamily II DNA helicase RecQ